MITGSLILTIIAALLLVNVLLWLLEIVVAIAKVLLGYLISKPCSFKASYRDIRVIVSLLIQRVMFAQVSPKNMKRDLHDLHISRKRNLRQEIIQVIKAYNQNRYRKDHNHNDL